MVDLQETPATPPEDPGGDERVGYFLAGGTLLALGWGLGVALNVLLHSEASSSGSIVIWGFHFGPTLGPYSWAVLALGLVTGAMGIVLLAVGRAAPKGRFVLPGADY
jgi:hypothetical protein